MTVRPVYLIGMIPSISPLPFLGDRRLIDNRHREANPILVR